MSRCGELCLCLAVLLPLSEREVLAQGYSLKEAAGKMTLPDGFSVTLLAGEPEVRQPILVKHDDRGRLWTIQYLQYPNPAGLKRVKVDRYSRTIYDRIPKPPPEGPKGADRITICDDTDGDGRADEFKDFINGLNLATGLAFGHGGVFVIQVPYLLFYPDRNRDDVPDGDPQVLLEGFGMEDAQALANHLTWGPDGWLYGLNGSTTTCRIRGIEFQQGVWRYHPISKEFELFCEGGGNVYGMTFDADGNLFYSSNGTRPSWHGVQGAYYHKAFGKHGQLHNPYAFGYFQFVPHENYRGGHVTCGGNFYYGDSFPASFRGKYIATNLLAHEVHWHSFHRRGSTFRSKREGELLLANDTWFAPTDLTVGPDGAVYVCDFHDKRTAHPDPDADWDYRNGRIYRIQAAAAEPVPTARLTSKIADPSSKRSEQRERSTALAVAASTGRRPGRLVDMHALSSDELIDWLSHTNYWYVRLARRILADRRDKTVLRRLRKMALESPDDHLALEALWALHVSGGFEDSIAGRLLGHRSGPIRSWTVRLLGDSRDVSAQIQTQLVELARTDPSPLVRCQLASTAKRLPAEKGLAIAWQLMLRDENRKDPFIPLLLWWAVESKAGSHCQEVLELLSSPRAWKAPLVRDEIQGRFIRRCAMEGSQETLTACARMVAAAPSDADRQRIVASIDEGLGGRPVQSPPEAFRKMIARLVDPETTSDVRLLRLALSCSIAGSHERIVRLAIDPKVSTPNRVSMLRILGQMGEPGCVPRILPLLHIDEQHDVEIATLRAASRFDNPRVAAKILKEYPRFSSKLKGICRHILLSREAWALALLEEVDAGRIDPTEVDVEELRGLEPYDNEDINALVAKYWGKITRGTPEEKLADIRRFNNDLRAFPGHAKDGYPLFKEHCANCHTLFGEGEDIGPDLTNSNRQDQDYILVSIVDPSSFIRVEYLSVQVITDDGRILTGLIIEDTPSTITLINSQEEKTTIARSNIDEMVPSQISQMPEDLLKQLTPQELRDLMAYLRSDGTQHK